MNPTTGDMIRGVFCASATPVLEGGAPDHSTFAAHCRALIEEGCDGVALLGTTGEANSFSIGQRQEILDRLVATGFDPQRLMPGTSQTNVVDTVTLVRHAMEVGARAAVVLPPFYYKGVSDEGLFRFYAEVVEGVARDDLKIVLYHIPPIAQVGLSIELVARLREAFPGIFVGIKDSSGKLESMQAFVAAFDDFSVLAGADPLMLPLLRSGGAGCITSSSNLIGAHLRIVFDHFDDPAAQDIVERAQERIDAWRNLSNAYVQLPTVKAMLARRRGHAGWARVRPPLVELAQAECEAVWVQMEQLEKAQHD